MDAHLRYFKQVYPCHYFHIDISRLCTNVIQTSSVAISSGIWTTTSDGTVYQSSNSLTHHITELQSPSYLLFYNGFVNYNASHSVIELCNYRHNPPPCLSICWIWQRLLTSCSLSLCRFLLLHNNQEKGLAMSRLLFLRGCKSSNGKLIVKVGGHQMEWMIPLTVMEYKQLVEVRIRWLRKQCNQLQRAR